MFAVPGWSVSADKLKSESAAPSQNDNKSKKRKRPSASANVTSDNVADLWEQVIEGGGKAGKKAKKSNGPNPHASEAKNEATGGDDTASGHVAGGQQGGQGGSRTQLTKKEKKNIKKKQQQQGDEASDAPRNDKTEGAKDPAESKKDKKSRKERRESQGAGAQDGERSKDNGEVKTAKASPAAAKPAAAAPKLTPLQASMREKLISARFRHLNETLYTKPSADAFELFEESPEMFQEYHEGFRRQVEVWPENPVDGYIADLQARGRHQRDPPRPGGDKAAPSSRDLQQIPLPRTNGTCRIADLGCGDGKLAESLKSDSKKNKNLRLQVLSYDLQSPSPLVTRADIANLPLADGSVNVAIFCLALMGTNWLDFIEEAYRILHWKGELWVAEIKSRFGPVGGAGGKGGGDGGGNKGVVSHSVGNRKKGAAAKKAGKGGKDKDGEDDGTNAMDLAVEVDGADDPRRAQETDVSAFVDALRKRGFVLQGAPDLNNKMFVRMRFLKATAPTVGKGVDAAAAAAGGDKGRGAGSTLRGGRGEGRGGAFGGGPGRQQQRQGLKFIDNGTDGGDEGSIEGEKRILKPCVYKIR